MSKFTALDTIHNKNLVDLEGFNVINMTWLVARTTTQPHPPSFHISHLPGLNETDTQAGFTVFYFAHIYAHTHPFMTVTQTQTTDVSAIWQREQSLQKEK